MQIIKKDDLINLPAQLKAWRKKYKITLQQLAQILKISHVAIAYWENGINQMKHKHLLQILEILGSPPPEPSPPVAKVPPIIESPTVVQTIESKG